MLFLNLTYRPNRFPLKLIMLIFTRGSDCPKGSVDFFDPLEGILMSKIMFKDREKDGIALSIDPIYSLKVRSMDKGISKIVELQSKEG